ncbi:MAG: hypothetical protein GX234_07105 [Clostridiales bacterium]|nr:hypothetical protein [Clostridiales bacterium]
MADTAVVKFLAEITIKEVKDKESRNRLLAFILDMVVPWYGSTCISILVSILTGTNVDLETREMIVIPIGEDFYERLQEAV